MMEWLFFVEHFLYCLAKRIDRQLTIVIVKDGVIVIKFIPPCYTTIMNGQNVDMPHVILIFE